MKRMILPSILLVLTFSACTDSDLETVSKSLLVAAKSLATVQSTVIKANEVGLMSEDTTRAVLQGCVKANLAGQQASQITRSISKLEPAQRVQMAPMVKAALDSIQSTLIIDLSGIKDPQMKAAITTGLETAKYALTVALTVLSQGGQ